MPHIIILAAGKGTRMRSDLPKVLHPIAGAPMIERVLRTAEAINPRPKIVVGYRAGEIIGALGDSRDYVVQEVQRGTGHAVQCALAAFSAEDTDDVFVMPGDHPFVTPNSIRKVIEARESTDAAIALATVKLTDFEGPRAQFSECGRIVRDDDGSIAGIIERKDATEEQAAFTEVNVSYYCFRGAWLKENIARIATDNAAGEYYLTDLVAAAFMQGETIIGLPLDDHREGMGVNTPEQLQAAEQQLAIQA
jgi:bifunctional UDP-N-acetylglucosamine pyrophosphorylase/glucosamine-1-phosphate N-acetyltransferase